MKTQPSQVENTVYEYLHLLYKVCDKPEYYNLQKSNYKTWEEVKYVNDLCS